MSDNRRRFTPAEDEFICTHRELTLLQIAEQLDRPHSSICHRSRRLGIERISKPKPSEGAPQTLNQVIRKHLRADPVEIEKSIVLHGLTAYLVAKQASRQTLARVVAGLRATRQHPSEWWLRKSHWTTVRWYDYLTQSSHEN